MNMSNERRTRERFPMTRSVELKTGDDTVITAQGINISEGGVLCRAMTSVAPGVNVAFQLVIPAGKTDITVECEGMVLRCVENSGQFDIAIEISERE